MNKWITIDFKNGEICHYAPSEYTDYRYDGKYFIVIKDKQWIGFYNLDEIRYVEISTVEEAEGKKKYTKAKYEAWKKSKDEIRVGDEVIYHGNKYVVGYVGADEVYHIVDQNWIRVVVQGDYQIFKTGRHFPEVEELLKKVRGAE